jgi:transcription-repair coupling factor (superfamily II helicase)
VNTLLLVMRIKSMCKKAGISRLDGGPKGATVQFHGDRYGNPAGLVEYIHADPKFTRVKDNKLVIQRDWASEADKIKGAFAIARDLAERAKPGAAPKAPPRPTGPPPKAPPPPPPPKPMGRVVPVERRRLTDKDKPVFPGRRR